MPRCHIKSKEQPKRIDKESGSENANVPTESRESPSTHEIKECKRACRRAQLI